MARAERILAIDIGATSIKLGEFEYPSREGVCLVAFAHREYEEELTESSRSVVVAGLLRQMIVEGDFSARRCVISISGQAAFTRFVRLPPVAEEESRIRQIVEFEARQNVPFPMEEVIWDYQLITNPDAEEMDVMFVVIKNEIVEQMTSAVQAVGLDPLLVDVAPAASYNAARANLVGEDECAMVLNIGGRSTNLLFADRNRFFARTIPIAGHSVTQQIAKEFGIGFAEAEELKRRHGFVALGGAYAEPESEVAAAVSKIIRNVMARLHGEINRSISVYRAHQKGSRPARLYLTGGSSGMTYTDHFFAEKLRMEVSYLNPFQVVALGPAIDRQRLQEVAHMFSEVIGLGLRYRVRCPIEVSLVPETIRRQQALRRKKPYVYACLACILLILFVAWQANVQRAARFSAAYEEVQDVRTTLEGLNSRLKAAQSQTAQRISQYENVTQLLQQRVQWPRVLNELFKLKPEDLWLVTVEPVLGSMPPIAEGAGEGMEGMGMGMEGMGEMGSGMGSMGMEGGMGMGMEGGSGMGMGMGDDMAGMGMGMGMDGMGEMGGAMGPSGQYVEITGLLLTGHSIILEAAARAERGAGTPAGMSPDEPPAPEEEQPGEDEDAASEAEGGGENDGMDLTGEDEGSSAAPRARGETPEQIYLARLRESELFDEDETYTGIQAYVPPRTIQNLSSFTIQVKFAEPLEFYYVGETTKQR